MASCLLRLSALFSSRFSIFFESPLDASHSGSSACPGDACPFDEYSSSSSCSLKLRRACFETNSLKKRTSFHFHQNKPDQHQLHRHHHLNLNFLILHLYHPRTTYQLNLKNKFGLSSHVYFLCSMLELVWQSSATKIHLPHV